MCLRSRWYALAKSSPRQYWRYEHSHDWWGNFVLSAVWDEERWVMHFRMTWSTLQEIADALRPRLEHQDTNVRWATPVLKHMAMTVWWLANVSSFCLLSEQFTSGPSTAAEVVIEVCLAMEMDLLGHAVYLGDIGKVGVLKLSRWCQMMFLCHKITNVIFPFLFPFVQIMDGFARLGFPHCIGALDGTHIPIIAPLRASDEYFNRKNFHSILLQGTCDDTGCVIDIELGWTGKNHDAHVFINSALCKAMDAGVFVPTNPTITISRVQIPLLIVTDAAYPLRTWPMKLFGGQRDRRCTGCDKTLSSVRTVVECAFGRLKARCMCLIAWLPIAIQNVFSVVWQPVWYICEEKLRTVLHEMPREEAIEIPDPPFQDVFVCSRILREGDAVRNALADFFFMNGLFIVILLIKKICCLMKCQLLSFWLVMKFICICSKGLPSIPCIRQLPRCEVGVGTTRAMVEQRLGMLGMQESHIPSTQMQRFSGGSWSGRLWTWELLSVWLHSLLDQMKMCVLLALGEYCICHRKTQVLAWFPFPVVSVHVKPWMQCWNRLMTVGEGGLISPIHSLHKCIVFYWCDAPA